MIVANSKSFTDLVGFPAGALGAVSSHGNSLEVHGTTVLSFRYKDGILNLADRRATAGNLVMYDQAEKIVALDDYTVI
jgi:proteasome beta subunit